MYKYIHEVLCLVNVNATKYLLEKSVKKSNLTLLFRFRPPAGGAYDAPPDSVVG